MSYDIESSDLAYDGALSRIRVDRVRMPDGEVAEREVVEHPDAVAVVAIDGAGRLVLLRQYRHPVGGDVLEIPAGKLDEAGESPEETAQRELAEEVGLAADRLEPLVTFHNSAGWTDESTTVFLATGLQEVGAPASFTPEAEEAHMEVVREPFGEVLAAARRGEIADAKTLIGILLAAGRGDLPA